MLRPTTVVSVGAVTLFLLRGDIAASYPLASSFSFCVRGERRVAMKVPADDGPEADFRGFPGGEGRWTMEARDFVGR